ncbi:MAG: transposase [Acidobacteriaceae bacterium]|nr:transposase [Acidobacteriaceae bacterium]
MLSLPVRLAPVILTFAPLFSRRVWQHVQVLLMGAILAPGKRTVTSCLRMVGRGQEPHFVNYHRVFSRARWSSFTASRLLLELLVRTFVPSGPVVLGLDDTVERRRGKRISALGIYRDPVRSSDSHFVKASGLPWLSLMLLAPVPWAGRVWALPFLTCLARSERYNQQQERRHKKLTDWARQMLFQAQRWLPNRTLVLVADSSFAALELLSALARHHTMAITRLRLDAALYEPPPARQAKKHGRPRKKGKRLPRLDQVLQKATTCWERVRIEGWYGAQPRDVELCSATALWYYSGTIVSIRWVLLRDPAQRFDPQALLCTDLSQTPQQIVQWFVQRWQVEVTFAEVRAHLGVETQRQWSDQAIIRMTPCLLALFSIVTLLAERLLRGGKLPVRSEAWYRKEQATFSDTLAAVRRHLWQQSFQRSPAGGQAAKLSLRVIRSLQEAICYAA